MPPLITREEALRLGQISDHGEIEALVERAWEARVERFGDSTDMCSLVNAKSGGCAEDCGFCAQSSHAEADTPMHAMMEPEQMLAHAYAAFAWSPRARVSPSATSRRCSRAHGSSPSTRT
jgi:biotin synthase